MLCPAGLEPLGHFADEVDDLRAGEQSDSGHSARRHKLAVG